MEVGRVAIVAGETVLVTSPVVAIEIEVEVEAEIAVGVEEGGSRAEGVASRGGSTPPPCSSAAVAGSSTRGGFGPCTTRGNPVLGTLSVIPSFSRTGEGPEVCDSSTSSLAGWRGKVASWSISTTPASSPSGRCISSWIRCAGRVTSSWWGDEGDLGGISWS